MNGLLFFLRFPNNDTLYRVFIKNGVVSNVYKSVIQIELDSKVVSLLVVAQTVMFTLI